MFGDNVGHGHFLIDDGLNAYKNMTELRVGSEAIYIMIIIEIITVFHSSFLRHLKSQ